MNKNLPAWGILVTAAAEEIPSPTALVTTGAHEKSAG